jgi:hypothetical protein
LYVEATNALCYGRALKALYGAVQAINCMLLPLCKRKLTFEILSDASIRHETGIELDKRENSFHLYRLVYSAEIKRQRSIASLFLRGIFLTGLSQYTEARIERRLVALEAITVGVPFACVDKCPTPSTSVQTAWCCTHSANIRSIDQCQGQLCRNWYSTVPSL